MRGRLKWHGLPDLRQRLGLDLDLVKEEIRQQLAAYYGPVRGVVLAAISLLILAVATR